MNDMKRLKISQAIWLLCIAFAFVGCNEDLSSSFSDDIKPGDPVMFAPFLSGRATTRTTDVSGYKDVTSNTDIAYYAFTYWMNKKVGEDVTEVKSGYEIYWPDNTVAYGFKATAGSEVLSANQSLKEDYLLQDQLIGYAAIASTDDNIEGWNYRTCVAWKAANGGSKILPVYLQHLRSRITVILKAGTGVRPEELNFAAATNNIAATIYSYGTTTLNISPWASEITIEAVKTTQYTAIVEPHNYESQNVVTINLSGQSITFNGSYDLSTPGKHLVLTLTLTRADTFKALVTAQVVDWDNVDPVNVTLDDFNQTN